MKFVLIHGDNTTDSYKRLHHYIDVARSRGWEIKRITDSKENISDVIVSQSLFESQRLIIIEGLNLINKKTGDWLKKKKDAIDGNIVIYEDSESTKTAQKLLSFDKVEDFPLPKKIWNFLDSFSPGNARNTLLLLHEVVKKEPVELVFALFAKQVRDLFWVKVESHSMPYPPWRVAKLKKQASKFTAEQLEKTIEELAEADVASKTSQANLSDLLDFIIVSQLQ